MRRWVKATLVAAGTLAGGAAIAIVLGGRRWERETARLASRIGGIGRSTRPSTHSAGVPADLPATVQRYFRFALTPGQRLVRTARVEHEGEFRTALTSDWSPFRSVQVVSSDPPGFVWDAKIAMLPVGGIRVRDHYLLGSAGMLGLMAGVVAVVDQEGSPELASGALHRYLAEAVWLPTALLPRSGVRWEGADDSTARVTLTDSGITVSMDVHFGALGEIVRVEAERYRDVNGVGVRTPFVAHFRDYTQVEGMRIPMSGEVEWILPEGRFTYWKGRVTGIEYEF
jgi:hypothetical protein